MEIEEQILLSLEAFAATGYLVVSYASDELASKFEKSLQERGIDYYVEHEFEYMTFHRSIK